MPVPQAVQLTTDEAIVRYTGNILRPVGNQFNVPAALSGKHCTVVAVITNSALTDAQEAGLKAAIEAIAGVDLAQLVCSSRLSLDRMPADTPEVDYQYLVRIELGTDIVAVPVEPAP